MSTTLDIVRQYLFCRSDRLGTHQVMLAALIPLAIALAALPVSLAVCPAQSVPGWLKTWDVKVWTGTECVDAMEEFYGFYGKCINLPPTLDKGVGSFVFSSRYLHMYINTYSAPNCPENAQMGELHSNFLVEQILTFPLCTH